MPTSSVDELVNEIIPAARGQMHVLYLTAAEQVCQRYEPDIKKVIPFHNYLQQESERCLESLARMVRGPLEKALTGASKPQSSAPQAQDRTIELHRQLEVLERQEKLLRDMIDGMKEELLQHQRTEAALKGEIAVLRDGAKYVSDEKFKAAKREFAKRYHPNSDKTTGFEKRIRSDAFKEFWPILERIEQEAITL